MVGAVAVPPDRIWTEYGVEKTYAQTGATAFMVYGVPKSSTDELSRFVGVASGCRTTQESLAWPLDPF
jgi:hypothetical protein